MRKFFEQNKNEIKDAVNGVIVCMLMATSSVSCVVFAPGIILRVIGGATMTFALYAAYVVIKDAVYLIRWNKEHEHLLKRSKGKDRA